MRLSSSTAESDEKVYILFFGCNKEDEKFFSDFHQWYLRSLRGNAEKLDYKNDANELRGNSWGF